MRSTLFIFSFLLLAAQCLGQTAVLTGIVRNAEGASLPSANVVVPELEIYTVTDDQGRFEMEVPSEKEFVLKCSYTGHLEYSETLKLSPGERKKLRIFLRYIEFETIDVIDNQSREGPMERIPPKLSRIIPNPSVGIESLIFSQLGVSTSNELSSSYSVRGGSFDENLVYVNDIEVYRPFLARSGQQEGLSFANPDMVSDILFSSGGFDARYGDKMSSTLDIKYTRPDKREGSFSGGLLGGSLHYGDRSKSKRFSHLTGVRYKTNSYLLGSLDESGDYSAKFLDLQSFLTYIITDEWQVEFLGNVANNTYVFIPQSRVSQFGSINQALQLTVFFDGRETTTYDTRFGALSFTNRPSKGVELKFITSAFNTNEREDFDVLGQYRLDELDRDLGSDEFGEVISNIGIGGYLNHARNRLNASVYNFSHKGLAVKEKHTINWGIGSRVEFIDDRLSEWQYVDSAGYSVPFSNNAEINLDDLIKGKNTLEAVRSQAFIQDKFAWKAKDSSNWEMNVGLRAHHWSYNQQTVISPRARITWTPRWTKTVEDSIVKRDIVLRAAGGLYYQPPFYRELRALDGTLNPEVRAQQSIHAVLGADMMISMFGRPYRLVTEAYYKQYNDLIPYELESVRLRYYAQNNARGFAYGLDAKINGEFIPGVESWASLSFLNSREDLLNDFYIDELADGTEVTVEPGYIPRPTDQRVNFSMLFRDELPMNPSYKVNLSVHYGSGLPYGPPDRNRYRDTLRSPSYRRFDIGFSKQLVDENTKFKNSNGFMSNFKEAWIVFEVFNLLDVPNVQSYLWVKDVRGLQYPAPNFLTPRRLNLRVYFRF